MRKRRNYAHGTRRQGTSCNSIGSHELKYMSSDISDGGFRAGQRQEDSYVFYMRPMQNPGVQYVKCQANDVELILSRDPGNINRYRSTPISNLLWISVVYKYFAVFQTFNLSTGRLFSDHPTRSEVQAWTAHVGTNSSETLGLSVCIMTHRPSLNTPVHLVLRNNQQSPLQASSLSRRLLCESGGHSIPLFRADKCVFRRLINSQIRFGASTSRARVKICGPWNASRR
ncbi:hypothetical protein IW262DRAFT_914520 [Armillaria fumosa]|nr:hypothetical protein IW262DRAFT_914520 [Armillaria fumosa]